MPLTNQLTRAVS